MTEKHQPVEPFETAEELNKALARVFSTLMQPGENRPALRAVRNIAEMNLEVAEFRPREKDDIDEWNKNMKAAYDELYEALGHHPKISYREE